MLAPRAAVVSAAKELAALAWPLAPAVVSAAQSRALRWILVSMNPACFAFFRVLKYYSTYCISIISIDASTYLGTGI